MAIVHEADGTRVNGSNTSGTITSVSSDSGTAVDDTLILFLVNYASGGGNISTITDDDSNTWGNIRSQAGTAGDWYTEIWDAQATATGTVNLTITPTNSGNYWSMICSRASGLDGAEDVGAGHTDVASASTLTTPTKTVDDCYVGTVVRYQGTSQTITAGYTVIITGGTGGQEIIAAYKIESDTGTEAVSPASGANTDAVITCLKIASSIEQAAFRYFDDDAAYASSTATEAQNTDITAAIAENHVVAVQLQASGNPPTGQYQIEYKKNGDADSEWEPLA